MKRKSHASRIREYLTAHPDAKPSVVAQALKCAVSNVYVAKQQMKANAKQAKPNNVRALDTPVAPVVPVVEITVHVDEVLAFITKVLTREELVGFYKASQVLSASGVDPAFSNLYVEYLRGALSPR